MLEQWIAETTECDFKVAVEVKKPKSWLKSVSAFANGIGGTIFFGVNDQREIIGVQNVHSDTEIISNFIKERISPYPNFNLIVECIDDKDLIILTVPPGHSTPYYYKANGIMQAYIRAGNTSVIAPSYILNQLILKGMNRSYDGLFTNYNFKDYSFSKLRERYKTWVGSSMEEKFFDSFELRNQKFELTNAGALLADDSPIKQSRLFCTRWNGLDKSGGIIDALDSAEYSGSLIILLNEGLRFIKRNMKTYWKKTANSRIEMPDYCERSIFEALVNALIHRDYTILGSEIHIDIYDDRLTITSPGGMNDGTRIQERDITSIASSRRNPILADIFGRIGYMERQGSGFKKITDAYSKAHNFHDDLEPRFYSDSNSFQVTLFNLNYRKNKKGEIFNDKVVVSNEKPVVSGEEVVVSSEEVVVSNDEVVVSNENNVDELVVSSEKVGVSGNNQLFGDTKVVVSDENDDEVIMNEGNVDEVVVSSRNQLFDVAEVVVSGEEVVVSNESNVDELVVSSRNQLFDVAEVVVSDDKVVVSSRNQLFDVAEVVVSDEELVVSDESQLFGLFLSNLNMKTTTKETVLDLYRYFGFNTAFSRLDIMNLTGVTSTPAGTLINKLKKGGVIIPVAGQGKGKYKFIIPSTKK